MVEVWKFSVNNVLPVTAKLEQTVRGHIEGRR